MTLEAMALNLQIIGVSFHCGSGCRNPESFASAVKLAKSAMDIVNRVQQNDCWLLDIGGGFPGTDGQGGDIGRFCGSKTTSNDDHELQGEMTTADIAAAVSPLLDKLFPDESKVHIIAEPGRYFVEGAFALCSRIYRVALEEENGGILRRHYYLAHGVTGVFKDVILCGESFVPIPLILDEHRVMDESLLLPTTVHGPSGEEYDMVCRDCELPTLEEGDWLLFDRMGAYTLSLAPRSGGIPIRYVMGERQSEI